MLEHCVLVTGTSENRRAHQLRWRLEQKAIKLLAKAQSPKPKSPSASPKKAK